MTENDKRRLWWLGFMHLVAGCFVPLAGVSMWSMVYCFGFAAVCVSLLIVMSVKEHRLD